VVNQVASELAKLRWKAIPKKQRSKMVPRNGGRKRIYPLCKRYKDGKHRWQENEVCKCGVRRLVAA
jgi:hypothetical protein